MNPDDPRHGTLAGWHVHYDAGEYPCLPCRAGKADYAAHVARQKAYGRWNPWVDAEPARQHVRNLMAEGATIRGIAAQIGVKYGRISHLLYGRQGNPPAAKIRPEYAERILSTTAPSARVTGLGAARRLQALVALGYASTVLAERLGTSQPRVDQWLRQPRGRMMRETHDRIAALYDELCMTRPDPQTKADRYRVSRALNTAKRNKWVPPLAWLDIDDPDEQPTGVRDPNRTLDRTAERADTIREVLDRGGNHYEAARVLDISVKALEKWCERHAMRHVYNKMRERAYLQDWCRNTGNGDAA